MSQPSDIDPGADPQSLFARALATISEGTMLTDAEYNIIHVNEAFTAITGYSQDDILGTDFRVLQGPGSDPATIARLQTTLAAGQVFRGEILNFRKDGTSFWNALTITPVKDPDGKTTHFISVQRDITVQKALEEQVRFLAHHDPATGLPNRNSLNLQLFEAIERATQSGGAVAVGIIDLDDFRAVNTSFDHQAGDQVISETARRLQGQLRKTDFVARIGGDKFAVIIENLDTAHADEQIQATMSHLYRVVEEPFNLPSGRKVSIGMSMGLALFPRDGKTANDLLNQADTALYEAKTAKDDRIQWWNTSTTTRKTPAHNTTNPGHARNRRHHPETQRTNSGQDELQGIEKLVVKLNSQVLRLVDNCSTQAADEDVRSANEAAAKWIQETLEDITATSIAIFLASRQSAH